MCFRRRGPSTLARAAAHLRGTTSSGHLLPEARQPRLTLAPPLPDFSAYLEPPSDTLTTFLLYRFDCLLFPAVDDVDIQ